MQTFRFIFATDENKIFNLIVIFLAKRQVYYYSSYKWFVCCPCLSPFSPSLVTSRSRKLSSSLSLKKNTHTHMFAGFKLGHSRGPCFLYILFFFIVLQIFLFQLLSYLTSSFLLTLTHPKLSCLACFCYYVTPILYTSVSVHRWKHKTCCSEATVDC